MSMTGEIAGLLLGKSEGEKFRVKWGWININLQIKPISTEKAIAITGLIGGIKKINDQSSMITAFIEQAKDLELVIDSIVIATGAFFKWPVKKALMGLPLSDIETLWQVVLRQMEMSRFFFIMVSANGQGDLLKPKTAK